MRFKRQAKWDSGERTSTVAQPLNPMPACLSGLGYGCLGTAHCPVERGLELFDRLQPCRTRAATRAVRESVDRLSSITLWVGRTACRIEQFQVWLIDGKGKGTDPFVRSTLRAVPAKGVCPLFHYAGTPSGHPFTLISAYAALRKSQSTRVRRNWLRRVCRCP